jgi:hypothetical protein
VLADHHAVEGVVDKDDGQITADLGQGLHQRTPDGRDHQPSDGRGLEGRPELSDSNTP